MYGYIVIYDLIKCVIDFYSQFGVKDKRHRIYSGVSSVSSHFFGFYSCIDNWIFGMNTVFKRLLMDKKFFVIVVVCYVFY